MGDIPAEREDEFALYVVQLDPTWDDEKIIQTIKYGISSLRRVF